VTNAETSSDPANALPVYLDCDTGIDDAMALLYLHAQPATALLGIGTVSGNVDAGRAALNTLALLEMLRADIPVAVGARGPLAGGIGAGARKVHGSTGTGSLRLRPTMRRPEPGDAADLLIRLAAQHSGELRVIATGPLTNLAVALSREPALVDQVAEVTVMGGAALGPGNLTPAAEVNIGSDPEAADVVFSAPWNLTMVGLDVTLEHRFDESDRQQLLRAPNAAVRAVGQMLDAYMDFYVGILGTRGCALHDPLAAAVGVGAVSLAVAPRVHVEVDCTSGPSRGRTVADLRDRLLGYPDQPGAHCRVVLAVDDPFPEHLRAVLTGLAP
jgi:purine nucleosidase